METAQENARRLIGKNIILPYPELCSVNQSAIVLCSVCGQEYCSLDCKNEAFNQYHSILCLQTLERNNTHPIEQLNETWK